MSADAPQSPGLGSPKTDSVDRSQPGEPAKFESRPDVPSVDERVAEFVSEYPRRAATKAADTDGLKLREEVVQEETVERVVDPAGEMESSFTIEEVERRWAVEWADLVREFLEWYEDNRGLMLRFSQDEESFMSPAENSWQPEYAERQYAQLQALARETSGGERPSGAETEGEYTEPWIAFVTRTASTRPADEYRPPVEHDRAIASTWSDDVYHTLRNTMSRLGLESDDWVYHKQGEPHAGGGLASCYGHDHTMVIFDAAGMDRDPTRGDFEPIIDKHVEAVDHAGDGAHDYDTSLTVEPVGDGGVGDVAGYMADYVSFDDSDLLERDIEYIAWGAIQWATNTQTAVRSDLATEAIAVDRCKQRANDPGHDQVRGHGDDVRRRERTRGGHHYVEYVCSCCGSKWGVDQGQTLVGTRLQAERAGSEKSGSRDESLPPGSDSGSGVGPAGAIADGGSETESERSWPSASATASAGESPRDWEARKRIQQYVDQHPDATANEILGGLLDVLPPPDDAEEIVFKVLDEDHDPEAVTGTRREPDWSLDAIVDKARAECIDCGHQWSPTEGGGSHCPRCGSPQIDRWESGASPGSVDMRPLILPKQRRSMERKAIRESLGGVEESLYTCDCGVTVGPASIVGHLVDHGYGEAPERAGEAVTTV